MNIQLNDRQRKRIIGILEQFEEDERDMWAGDEEEYDGNFEEDMAGVRAMVEVLEGKTGQAVPEGRWGP